jgi:hypothetical protein
MLDMLLSTSAFNLNLRRYSMAEDLKSAFDDGRVRDAVAQAEVPQLWMKHMQLSVNLEMLRNSWRGVKKKTGQAALKNKGLNELATRRKRDAVDKGRWRRRLDGTYGEAGGGGYSGDDDAEGEGEKGFEEAAPRARGSAPLPGSPLPPPPPLPGQLGAGGVDAVNDTADDDDGGADYSRGTRGRVGAGGSSGGLAGSAGAYTRSHFSST